MKIVADTSIIINGELLSRVESGLLHDAELVLPQAVLDELQSQASQKLESGYAGLEMIKKLQDLSKPSHIEISISGERPTLGDINLAQRGRIDAMIVDVARDKGATLYTSDRAQHMAAQAEGTESVLVVPKGGDANLEFLKYFDRDTMSVHLKEGLPPMAKRGKPGSFELATVGPDALSAKYLESISSQILGAARLSGSATTELSSEGASVIQYGDYRIAITRQPFSEAHEITIVHPIVRLSLDDYEISDALMARFANSAKGVLISGAPGSGKSTLASGLANFYHGKGRIVKTFESPRDLQVEQGITQYTKLDGSFENTADILLLVRPDYTIFDEVRRREDFATFSDLRLAGVGMVGVIHANAPLDAIQRFIGKIELGMIPSVIDTVVFVQNGQIGKVYDLQLKVKVPTGMTESDLARPVIEVRDFADNALEHEIYTFGEENVIVPVSGEKAKSGIERLAEERIRDVFRRYDPRARVDVVSAGGVKVTVSKHRVASIIGRGGSNISDLQKQLGIHIDVVSHDARNGDIEDVEERGHAATTAGLPFKLSESRNALLLLVGREYAAMHADIYVGGRHVTTSRIGRKGQIKLHRRSEAARHIMDSASSQDDIQVNLKDA